MAIKPILTVDVDDSAFRRFQDLFSKYETALAKTPGVWRNVNVQTAATAASFEQMAALALTQNQLGAAAAKQQTAIAKAVNTTAAAWQGMARSTKSVATNIIDATRSLLRWAELTSVFTGLLGAGGLFGISRLAQSAGNQRRSGLGLGVTPGQQNAFSVNYGRVVDPDSFLSGVNESLHDITKRGALLGAGLSATDIDGKSTGDVASSLISALKKIADQTPEAALGNVLKARGLDQFITLQDFERLKRTPSGELAGYGNNYQRDRKTLDLTEAQQRAWQDLQVQLHRAGESIEAIFIRRLTPLAPSIEHLSEAFTHAVDVFLSQPKIKEWIDDLAKALESFAVYVSKPEFEQNIKDFVSGVGDMADALGRAVKWILGWFPDKSTVHVGPRPDGSWGIIPNDPDQELNRPNPDGTFPDQIKPSKPPRDTSPPDYMPFGGSGYNPIRYSPSDSLFGGIESRNQLPGGILDAVWNAESGRGQHMRSVAGALGHFQFLPSTADQYGVTDPYDLTQSAKGAGMYLHDLIRMFGGDVTKGLAAYNWGPGNLQKDIASYGDNWRSHLPNETKSYVDKITRALAPAKQRSKEIYVRIDNQAGANVFVSANSVG